ncbi:hypothetical protein, partial [Miniphocaeibacter sp.]|uniref:hypothetical protein n=1 Tax=Miniphocaeibacter sp. TaxID=3100973 RepID=UPI003BB1B381
PLIENIMDEHQAYNKQSDGWRRYFNSALDYVLGMKLVDGKIVSNPDVKYNNTMSMTIGEVGNRERARYLDQWRKDNKGKEPDDKVQADARRVGAEIAAVNMARVSGIVRLFKNTERKDDGTPGANPGSVSQAEASKYMDEATLSSLAAAHLLYLGEDGIVRLRDPSALGPAGESLLADALELADAVRAKNKPREDSLRAKLKDAKQGAFDVPGAYLQAVEAVAKLATLTPAQRRTMAVEQNIHVDKTLDLDEKEKYDKSASEARARGDKPLTYAEWTGRIMHLDVESNPGSTEKDDGSLEWWLGRLIEGGASMSTEEKVKAAAFLTGSADFGTVDEIVAPYRAVRNLQKAGGVAWDGDSLVERKGGARFTVESAKYDPKARTTQYEIVSRTVNGIPIEASRRLISAEALKSDFTNDTPLRVRFTQYDRVEGSLSAMRRHLATTGYISGLMAKYRKEGDTLEKQLGRIGRLDLLNMQGIRVRTDKDGKEIFSYSTGSASWAGGISFNPYRAAGAKGYHVAEDFLETALWRAAVDDKGEVTAEALRANVPGTIAALTKGLAAARADLKKILESDSSTAKQKEAADDALADLDQIPDFMSDRVNDVVEAVSKFAARDVLGWGELDKVAFLPLSAGFKALREHGGISPKDVQIELERISSKEFLDALRYQGARASAESEPGKAEAAGEA